jgi:hypothetical protein
MPDPVIVDLFVEDRAHEELLKPLLRRLADDEAVRIELRARSGRGGHARAIREYELYQRIAETGGERLPDLVVVGVDGNCTSFARKRKELRDATKPFLLNRLVAACPDPHVERWYLADPDSFQLVVGHRPRVGRAKCVRDHYKRLLADAVRLAGHPPTLGGIEFAAELVAAMDIYRAGRHDRSLRAFVDDFRHKLRLVSAE